MAIDLDTGHSLGWHEAVYVMSSAQELAADIDVEAAARAVTADIVAEAWADIDDPSFHLALFASVRANIETIFEILAGRRSPEHVPAPALEFADVCAHLGIPSGKIERCYRVGVASLWMRWCDFVSPSVQDAGATFDDVIKGPTLAIHRYVDQVCEAVVERHQEVRAELSRTQRDRRRIMLEQLLDGSLDVVPEELERALGYSVSDTHIALLVETTRMTPPNGELVELRRAADARASIVLQHTPNAWIVWLGRSAPYEPHHLAALRRALHETGFTVAVGDPALGLAGLRGTRDQAFEAARVQRALGPATGSCTWLRDVRLEALLLADEARARAFVTAELGSLATDDEATARLRETLLTWLDVGSHVSAAAMLGVHENTVRNRVRAAEDQLGNPLLGRRTELQVALRLQRMLSDPAA